MIVTGGVAKLTCLPACSPPAFNIRFTGIASPPSLLVCEGRLLLLVSVPMFRNSLYADVVMVVVVVVVVMVVVVVAVAVFYHGLPESVLRMRFQIVRLFFVSYWTEKSAQGV